jgi:hypothetical protein
MTEWMTGCRRTQRARRCDQRGRSHPGERGERGWSGCWASVTSDEGNDIDLLQNRAGKTDQEKSQRGETSQGQRGGLGASRLVGIGDARRQRSQVVVEQFVGLEWSFAREEKKAREGVPGYL